jgi:hypothetical protein
MAAPQFQQTPLIRIKFPCLPRIVIVRHEQSIGLFL